MKLSKCEFWLREVSLLGHVISSGGIVAYPLKVNVVLQWEASKTITKIICFFWLGWLLSDIY